MSDTNDNNGTSKKNVFVHPLFLIVVTTILGGIGYLFDKYVMAEQSDFRFVAQNIEQYTVLSEEQPTVGDSIVYCATFRIRLLLAHNGKGDQNVTIHRISVNVEPTSKLQPQPTCVPDLLAGRPAGVTGTESIKIYFDGSNVTARRYLSRTDSRLINAQNLLVDEESARTVTLKPNEKSVSYDVFVTSRVSDIHEVYFEAVYDLDGEKTKRTEPILLAGPP